jgi:oligosaccharide reducing-end xylanase
MKSAFSIALLAFLFAPAADRMFAMQPAAAVNSAGPEGLAAMNAVASLAADHSRAADFVTTVCNTPFPNNRYRYHDGMLYLVELLHCSGEFRVWTPN